MQRDLLDELVSKSQRETAGGSTAARFDYQKNWAFCEMLRRHMASADYLVAFEFHDDVVFIEPNAQPPAADFIQVKTTSSAKPRTISDLTTRKKLADKSLGNSILGKMCQNFEGLCSGYNLRVILVSNVAFEFADKTMGAKDIEQKYRDKIVAKLKTEIPTLTDAQIDCLHFMAAGVSIESIQSYLHGEAMALFKSHFGEDHGLNVHSWVRLVQGEITRKNNYPSDSITAVSDLVAKKCISRSEVLGTLSLVSKSKRAPDMNLINGELKAAGWTATELIKLGKCMPTATYDYTDATNSEVSAIIESMAAAFDSNKDGSVSISEFIQGVLGKLLPGLTQPYNDKSYLSALAILVFHEKI